MTRLAALIYAPTNMPIDSSPYEVASETPAGSRTRFMSSQRLIYIGVSLAVFLLILITAATSWLAGTVVGESSTYHRIAARKMATIESFLDQHSEKYTKVTVHEASSGHAYLMGSVDAVADFDLLRTEMERAFGAELAQEMMRLVDVGAESSDGRNQAERRE